MSDTQFVEGYDAKYDAAYMEGYYAYLEGDSISDNPYAECDEDEELYWAWKTGFEEALWG